MSAPGSNRAATWRDFLVLTSVGAVLFGAVATQSGGRPAAIATGAYSIVALMVLAYRYDARETAAEAAYWEQRSREQAERRAQRQEDSPTAPTPAADGSSDATSFRDLPEAAGGSEAAAEEPSGISSVQDGPEVGEDHREAVAFERSQGEADGLAGGNGTSEEEEEAARQAVATTQAVSPALYGTGVVDEVSGEIGQVNLLETGLNVLAKVNKGGTIDEVNEGMEVVTGVPRDDLLGTDAFSYFTEPTRVKGWFEEALKGSVVRNKEVEVVHQEGETTPLTYNVIASLNGKREAASGVLLCRYRED